MKEYLRRAQASEERRHGLGILFSPPGDRGIVLVIGIMFIVVLAALGTIGYITASNDLMISRNYMDLNAASYSAKAGLAEAKERLRLPKSDAKYMGDPSAGGNDAWWSAYLLPSANFNTGMDPAYSSNYRNYIPTSASKTSTSVAANSAQTANSDFWVKIRHKREYDAEQLGHTTAKPHYLDNDGSTSAHTAASPGNIIYYGYGNPANNTQLVQFTTAAGTSFRPVEVVTAYGTNRQSGVAFEAEMVRFPGPPIVGAIYAKGDVTGNGSSLSVDGSDNCGVAAAKPPIYTLQPSITNTSGSPTLAPTGPVTGPDNLDIVSYVNALKASISVVLTSDVNGATIGSSTNYLTVYSDTNNPYNVGGLKLQNVTGYGILLVEGDCTFGGGFTWNGLVLVTGTLVFNGGGAGINIRGAVMAEQTVDLNGGIDVRYDSCHAEKAVSTQSLDLINWRDVNLLQ
ncbi:MAG: hypothetical protein AB1921_05095 [Thermodesulfobacteriota bacterium]